MSSRTYEAVLEMSQAVKDAAKPGARTTDLVRLADDVARSHGSGLWLMFLGHGIGLDCHERPDMGVEELTLEENMVITVERASSSTKVASSRSTRRCAS